MTDQKPGIEIPPGTACKYCNSTDLRIEYREKIIAKPIGSFSLAGAQVKFSGHKVDWPWMVCGGCHHESEGKP